MSSEPPDESPWLIDFFEEGETHENVPHEEPASVPVRSEAPPRRVSRGPSIEGRTRAVRLAVLVVVILVVAVVIIIVIGGGSEAGADTAYLSKVAVPAQDSQSVGAALNALLSGAPPSVSGLESSLSQLLTRQQRDLSETAAISPPPRLRTEQQQAVSAMQFRVGGLSGLLSGLQEAVAHPTEADWAAELSVQADGLIASDVIWRDFFVGPTTAQVASDGTLHAIVPSSTFVPNANITAPGAMLAVLQHAEGHSAAPPAPTVSTAAVLQLGDHSAAVKAWQVKLNKWIAHQAGLTKIKVTGSYDKPTQTATEALQTAAHITVDGIAGPETQAALTTALAHG
jgi:peptidoglycan hydrolase-like protein with peptidoglycan-binding domain